MNFDYSLIEIAEGGPGVAVTCRAGECSFGQVLDDQVSLNVILAVVQDHIESAHPCP